MRVLTMTILALLVLAAGCDRQRSAPIAPRGAHPAGPMRQTAPLGLKPGEEIAIPMGSAGKVIADLRAGRPVDPKLWANRVRKPARRGDDGRAAPRNSAAYNTTTGKPAMDRTIGVAAQKRLRELYEVLGGQPTRVVSASVDSGMWRFVFEAERDGKKSQQVAYVTADGRRFFEGGGTHIVTELATLKRDKRFATCLAESKVRIFGDSRQKTTFKQIKVIGKFGGLVFIDCAKNAKNCTTLGVKTLPTTAVGDKFTPGVQTRAFFETATGCK